ncbi:MAG: hemin uptake protein HemP [Pseudomonadota bacterium]
MSSTTQNQTKSLPTERLQPTSSTSVPTFSSKQLFGGATEINIEHQDLLYKLRITKQDKLILNK